MKKFLAAILAFVLSLSLLCGFTACASGESGGGTDTSEVADDYYIDLTDLGMNLTVYLRLREDGTFMFSNTLSFATDKSSGTFRKSGDSYIMVYTSVNGEAKSISDGLTSTFAVTEDGSLDFTLCERIYYGSATATTTSEDNPDARMIAVVVPEGFEEPSTETDFAAGVYTCADVVQGETSYAHAVTFFGDGTYLHFTYYTASGSLRFAYESGTYSVSTTQLALTPAGADRTEGEVVSGTRLNLSVLPYPGAEERQTLSFERREGEAAAIASFAGSGTVTGSSETFEASLLLYSDGSYACTAGGFEEGGLFALDSAAPYAKQYPDNPQTGERGMAQVTATPAAQLSYGEDGRIVITDFRARTGSSFTRYRCTLTQQEDQ